MFSEIQVFKCFLCACAANDAGRKATRRPSAGASRKAASYLYLNIIDWEFFTLEKIAPVKLSHNLIFIAQASTKAYCILGNTFATLNLH